MCGIVGYIGEKKAAPLLMEGLKKLEYRGYDSAGMVTLDKGTIHIRKDIGKIEQVDRKVNFSSMPGSIGLAHSRWATHGGVTQKNAHPHCNRENSISLIHNGIIENYVELKNKLLAKGVQFCSETDTEVIVHLIDHYYTGDLKNAVIAALRELRGAYAIGVISSKNPDVLIAARNESPLVIGIGNGENFIASDAPALL